MAARFAAPSVGQRSPGQGWDRSALSAPQRGRQPLDRGGRQGGVGGAGRSQESPLSMVVLPVGAVGGRTAGTPVRAERFRRARGTGRRVGWEFAWRLLAACRSPQLRAAASRCRMISASTSSASRPLPRPGPTVQCRGNRPRPPLRGRGAARAVCRAHGRVRRPRRGPGCVNRSWGSAPAERPAPGGVRGWREGCACAASTTTVRSAPSHRLIRRTGSPSQVARTVPAGSGRAAAWCLNRSIADQPTPSSRRKALPTPMTALRVRMVITPPPVNGLLHRVKGGR